MLPNLSELLAYKNPPLIKRFEREFPQHKDRGEKLFTDLLKYLWVCKKHAIDKKLRPDDNNLNFVIVMHMEMRDMDDMWHNFILHTRDYAEFCHTYFGDFIHHVPNVVEDNPQVFADFEEEFTKYLSYVYDHLGEETVCEWFAEHLQDNQTG